MKRNFKYYAICWAVLLAVFNVIAFAVPNGNRFSSGFWVGYVFITLAFFGQLACAFVAFKEENNEKFFYNVPLIAISYTATVVSAIAGSVCMAISAIPDWLAAVIGAVILGISAVAVLSAKGAADEVSAVDNKVKTQTLFIKSLTIDAKNLLAHASSDDMKAACKKVYEAVRYSDPMSNEALSGIESQITLKFDEFSTAVTSGADTVGSIADALVILLGDRNRKCKLLK